MAGRMTARQYPDDLNDAFSHDAAGRITLASSGRYDNSVARTYTDGLITAETLTIGGQQYSLGYGYDNASRLTSQTYPSGRVMSRSYTSRGQLAQVDFANSTVITRTYDDGGRPTTTTFGNNLQETRSYLTPQNPAQPFHDNLPTSMSVPNVIDFTYVWDVNRRKLSEVNGLFAMQSHQYGYDNEDRLVDAKRGDGGQQNWERQQSWSLSAVGDWASTTVNGTTETRTHDAVHELTAVGSASLTYDTNGNLTGNGATGWTYTWDYKNHMTGADFETAPTTTAVYAYDALGRRVSKVVEVTGNEFTTSTTTIFVNDKDWREVAEFETSGTTGDPPGTPALMQEYAFGDYVDEVLLMRKASGDKFYYHANDLYSVAALTDANGSVVERYKYDSYGQVTILAPDGTTVRGVSSYGNPWTFTGRRLDRETDLLYNRNREYGPPIGRFISRDPIGYAEESPDMYQYVGNRATTAMDPQGLFRCCSQFKQGWELLGYPNYNQCVQATKLLYGPAGWFGAMGIGSYAIYVTTQAAGSASGGISSLLAAAVTWSAEGYCEHTCNKWFCLGIEEPVQTVIFDSQSARRICVRRCRAGTTVWYGDN